MWEVLSIILLIFLLLLLLEFDTNDVISFFYIPPHFEDEKENRQFFKKSVLMFRKLVQHLQFFETAYVPLVDWTEKTVKKEKADFSETGF